MLSPSRVKILTRLEGARKSIVRVGLSNFLPVRVDYRVDLYGVEVRVQQNRRQQGFAAGEPCGLVFRRCVWYA